ncbi:unnamed protein product [Heterobilharzia americana]|nr:unnamed protein product [Heterobilharzia americana]
MTSTKRQPVDMVETKEYLVKNGIPQLFECLMTGLMYHRPVDHLNYLQQCLEKIKKRGIQDVSWDMFLEPKPLERGNLLIKPDDSQCDPVPEISSTRLDIKPLAAVVCIIAGPGVDKSTFSTEIISHYPKFIYVNMPKLLKKRAKIETDNKEPRWPQALKMINNGELLPTEMVLESFLWKLNQHADADGFIVDGYPRTESQYSDLKKHVGLERLAQHLSEQISQVSEDYENNNVQQTIEHRLCLFKTQTLPTCKLIDNDEKLRVVDGESKPDVIANDILKICQCVLSGKMNEPEGHPSSGSLPNRQIPPVQHGMMGCDDKTGVFNLPRIIPVFPDNGRIHDLHNCLIILLFGGPGSGRTEQASALCKKLPVQHVLDLIDEDSGKDLEVIAHRIQSSDPPTDQDRFIPEYWDLQIDIIRQEFNNIAMNSRAVIIEGFPCHEGQVNTFNQHIGGVDLAILLDCVESSLQERLHQRHYDELRKLVTIPGDREQNLVLNDFMAVVEYFLRKKESTNPSADSSAFVDTEEIIPEMSKLIKEEYTYPLQGVVIDDDKSLEAIVPEANQTDTVPPESNLDNSTNMDNNTKLNSMMNICKPIYIIGCCEDSRRAYTNCLVKKFNYTSISMDNVKTTNDTDDDNHYNLDRLIHFMKENSSKDCAIEGIPNSLKQAKEIDSSNNLLKFSNCKMIILSQKKGLDPSSTVVSKCDEVSLESDLIDFLESTGKLYRVPCTQSENEIEDQLGNLFKNSGVEN